MESVKSDKVDVGGRENREGCPSLQQLIAASVHERLVNASSPEEVGELIECLLEYSKLHAVSQEFLMNLYQYPQYVKHSREHDLLISQIEKLQETSVCGETENILRTLGNFRQKLDKHLNSSDMRFSIYFAQYGRFQE
jgi:hemerythrin